MTVRVSAAPDRAEVEAGEVATFGLAVTNQSEIVDAFHAVVFGVDQKWVEQVPASLSLFPGESDRDSGVAELVDPPVSYELDSLRPLTWDERAGDVGRRRSLVERAGGEGRQRSGKGAGEGILRIPRSRRTEVLKEIKEIK